LRDAVRAASGYADESPRGVRGGARETPAKRLAVRIGGGRITVAGRNKISLLAVGAEVIECAAPDPGFGLLDPATARAILRLDERHDLLSAHVSIQESGMTRVAVQDGDDLRQIGPHRPKRPRIRSLWPDWRDEIPGGRPGSIWSWRLGIDLADLRAAVASFDGPFVNLLVDEGPSIYLTEIDSEGFDGRSRSVPAASLSDRDPELQAHAGREALGRLLRHLPDGSGEIGICERMPLALSVRDDGLSYSGYLAQLFLR
jgi:hypothetical protein